MDAALKERIDMIGSLVATIEVEDEFWNPTNKLWQVPNNHTMLMMRTFYHKHEDQEDMKKTFGKFLDLSIWMYVSFPEYRARIGWTAWFLQLYINDKQFKKESGGRGFYPEVWNDPRKWALALEVGEMDVKVEVGKQVEVMNVGDGGLGDQGSH